MSDQEQGKKMVEWSHLERFLEAYSDVTGQLLEVVGSGERPDFTCVRPNGEEVGVELTQTPHDYEKRNWDRIWADQMTLSSWTLLELVHLAKDKKAPKLRESDWRTKKTILVIELVHYTFFDWDWLKEFSLQGDFRRTGFCEIWIADHTTLDAYGEVQLVGLYPKKYWGLYDQGFGRRKPFG